MLNNKYYNIYFLFIFILFLSTTVFSYDEEKIVVLCLISFITIVYSNFNTIIFNSLNDQSVILINELRSLFKLKFQIMKKLRYSWRIFLDIEDIVIDMYSWVLKKFKKIIINRNFRRLNFFWSYFIKKNLNKQLQKKLVIHENFKKLILSKLKFKLLNLNKFNIKFINNLKTLPYKYNLKHILINKLNKNVLNYNLQLNYNTYFFFKW